MDYGAGSGVLAVAALKLGAMSAAATDVDACAVSACRANAQLNGVEGGMVGLRCERDLQVSGALPAGTAATPFCLPARVSRRGPPGRAGHRGSIHTAICSSIKAAECVPVDPQGGQRLFPYSDRV